MIALRSDVRVYLVCGYTDMRKSMQELAMLGQQDSFNGVLYAFRGRRGNLLRRRRWNGCFGARNGNK
jgi:transposase